MNKLPMGWVWTELGQIADWSSGGTPSRKNPEYYNGDIAWIKTGDLGEKYINQTSEHITQEAIKNSSAKLFPKGSVALAMYGATIGKTSILGIDATTNQACAVALPNDYINNEFLYYLLLNEKDNFILKGQGGAQPNISQTVIKNHEIPLPPKAEQDHIATLLDNHLSQVAKIEQKLKDILPIIKQFRQSVLAQAVSGKLTGLQDKFEQLEVIKLESLILKSGNGISKRQGEDGKDVTVLRLADFKDAQRVYGNERQIALTEKEIMQYKLNQDDILVIRVNGSVDLAGKFILYSNNKSDEAYCDHFIRLKLDTDKILPKYMLYLANFGNGREYLKNSLSTSAGQNTINQTSIKNMSLKLPPLPEQLQIVTEVERLFAVADSIETQVNEALERVGHLTQSILHQAFTGNLSADWRACNAELITGEHSATALLAQLNAQKAVKKTKKHHQ